MPSSQQHIQTLRDLERGDALIYDERTEPVFVREVETRLHEEHRIITIVHRVRCDGSRGGTVVLEELQSGRIRSRRNDDESEGRTVTDLRTDFVRGSSGERPLFETV